MIDFTNKKMIDISHMVDSNMPADPSLKLPSIEYFSREGMNGALHNLEIISYCPHTGTHMDAPFHVDSSKGTIESVDPTILIGNTVIIRLKYKEREYEITKEDIIDWEKNNFKIQENDAVIFNSNHSQYWEQEFDEYIAKGFIYLSPEAAEYLVSKKIRFVGLESISVDK